MPDDRNGKICYIEIPTTDVATSAAFYERVFDWKSRKRGDGAVAFDDTTGQVSGSWVLGRAPAQPGALIYIMVDDAEDACARVIAAGGKIVQKIGEDAPEITARFTDPAGNIFGLYQQPPNR